MCSDATATKPSMPSRRSRKRTRKPKYLSLCRQLARPSVPAPATPPPPTPPLVMVASTVSPAQLDLSFLHPDHHERDPHVACLLSPNDDDANGVPSLAALLGSASAAGAPSEETPSPPRSASGVWEGDGEGLARRALRGRERWVFCCCSSASSSSSSEQEASSGIDLLCCAAPHALSLKLDYEEILTAWSDRGSLYIEGEGPQVVPEIHHTTSFVDVAWMGNSSLWRVPDMDELVKDDDQTEGKKAESRQASVKRYKEKRRSRLFSKRIRYEVRKLNAEKRPRMKGRFVKRNDDV